MWPVFVTFNVDEDTVSLNIFEISSVSYIKESDYYVIKLRCNDDEPYMLSRSEYAAFYEAYEAAWNTKPRHFPMLPDTRKVRKNPERKIKRRKKNA